MKNRNGLELNRILLGRKKQHKKCRKKSKHMKINQKNRHTMLKLKSSK